MGENVEVKEQPHTAEALREQIRDTESHITETVQILEERFSPRALGRRGVRTTKRAAWTATSIMLEFAQHTAVQASVVGGGVLWMLIRNRKSHGKLARNKPAPQHPAIEKKGTAALALGAAALEMLTRRKEKRRLRPAAKASAAPSVSRIGLAATTAKAFLQGARISSKKGTTRPGRKLAWRSLATAIGSALGSYWYSHKGRSTARAR